MSTFAALRAGTGRFAMRFSRIGGGRPSGRTGLGFLAGLVMAGLAVLLLAFWWLNVGILVEGIRPIVSLDKVQIALAKGESAIIGRRELLQPARFDTAELQHVSFNRGQDGKIIVRNVARDRKLWLEYANGSSSFSARWQLLQGDRIQAGPMSLTVDGVGDGLLRLSVRNGAAPAVPVTVARSGTTVNVTVANEPLKVCDPPKAMDNLRQFVTGFLAADERGEDRVLNIGGRLTCNVRHERYLAAARLPFRSFTITARGDRFFFSPGDPIDAPRPAAVFVRGGTQVPDFQSIGWDFDSTLNGRLTNLVIGRTRYRVEMGTEANGRLPIILTPVSKTHRLGTSEAAELIGAIASTQVTPSASPPRQPMSREELGNTLQIMNGGERVLRLAIVGGIILLALLAILRELFALRRGFGLIGGLLAPIVTLGLIGLTALLVLAPEIGALLRRNLSFTQEIRATILGFGVASIAVLLSARFTIATRIVWLAVLGLCMLGNLTLLSLGVDGEKTDFAIHAQKNKLLFIDLVPVFATVIAVLPERAALALPRSFFAGTRLADYLVRTIPALGIVAAFVLWAIVGTETGVAGFQPVEFGKLALVFMLASICVSFARINFFYSQRQYIGWLLMSILSVGVLFLVMTAVPFLKSDYSPILIILATTVVLFFSFLLPTAVWRVADMVGALLRRNDAPQPRQRQLGVPRGGALAVTLIILLALNAALVIAFPGLASYAIAGQWRLPKDRNQAIELLERARDGSMRKPAERLLTWYDLDHYALRPKSDEPVPTERTPDVAHRDLGFQLLQSKIALSEMPCTLTRLRTGINRLPPQISGWIETHGASLPTACDLMPDSPTRSILEVGEAPSAEGQRGYGVRDLTRLPVVQNDFIATYLLVRFGLPMGLLLFAAEFLLVIGAVVIAFGLRVRGLRGSSDEAARNGLSIAAVGVAALFALHWGISWGNAIGILPVMGQPMTFIAAATSHHLLMALPGIAILLLAGRVAAIGKRRIHHNPPGWGLMRDSAK